MDHAIISNDFEVSKYVLSIDGIRLNDDILLRAIMSSTFDVVVYLLNVYLCKSIPSHLHNQFHIFQFSNLPYNQNSKYNVINNNILNNYNNIKEEFNSKTHKRDRSDDSNDAFINQNNTINLSHHHYNLNNDGANDYFLKLVEHNFNKIIIENDRIWRGVCHNKNVDVVQLILSLKGIQPDLLNRGDEFNPFL